MIIKNEIKIICKKHLFIPKKTTQKIFIKKLKEKNWKKIHKIRYLPQKFFELKTKLPYVAQKIEDT